VDFAELEFVMGKMGYQRARGLVYDESKGAYFFQKEDGAITRKDTNILSADDIKAFFKDGPVVAILRTETGRHAVTVEPMPEGVTRVIVVDHNSRIRAQYELAEFAGILEGAEQYKPKSPGPANSAGSPPAQRR